MAENRGRWWKNPCRRGRRRPRRLAWRSKLRAIHGERRSHHGPSLCGATGEGRCTFAPANSPYLDTPTAAPAMGQGQPVHRDVLGLVSGAVVSTISPETRALPGPSGKPTQRPRYLFFLNQKKIGYFDEAVIKPSSLVKNRRWAIGPLLFWKKTRGR